ncbi:hypothetical protein VYU27_007247, partial [Nannochloropsis oceanica]
MQRRGLPSSGARCLEYAQQESSQLQLQ